MNKVTLYVAQLSALVKSLSNEQAGELLRMIIEHSKDNDVGSSDPLVQSTFTVYMAEVEVQVQHDKEVSRKRSIAGSHHKGNQYTSKLEQMEQMEQNGTNGTREEKDNEKEKKRKVTKENKEEKEKEKERESPYVFPQGGKQTFQPPTIQEVSDYLKEKNILNIDAEHFVCFYESKGWMIGKNKMKNWHAAITTWQKAEEKRQYTNGTSSRINRFTPGDARDITASLYDAIQRGKTGD